MARTDPAILPGEQDRGDPPQSGGGLAVVRVHRGEFRRDDLPRLVALAGREGIQPRADAFGPDFGLLAAGERPRRGLRRLARRSGRTAVAGWPDSHSEPGADPGGALRVTHRLV